MGNMNESLREHYLAQAAERAEHYRIEKMLEDHQRQTGFVLLGFIIFWAAWAIAVVMLIGIPVWNAVWEFVANIIGMFS